ncbi:unnamed protein product [Amoebophrya sp. A120]|nr:unnamed protein product [Amoebophrya sp. A120]|eukprot:GSA120T00012784001.1
MLGHVRGWDWRGRFFFVRKPSGFALRCSPLHPSVERNLQSRTKKAIEYFFPYSLDLDTEGLQLVTKDEYLARQIEKHASGIVHCYRLWADISMPRRGSSSEAMASRSYFDVLPSLTGSLLQECGRAGDVASGLGNSTLHGLDRDVTSISTSPSELLFTDEELRMRSGNDLLATHGTLASTIRSRGLKLRSYFPELARDTDFHAARSALSGVCSERSTTASSWALPLGSATSNAAHRTAPAAQKTPNVKMSDNNPGAFGNVLSKSMLFESKPGAAHQLQFQLLRSVGNFGLYDVQVRSPACHQVRVQFADAGCPVEFDRYYHWKYNEDVRRNAFDPQAAGGVPGREDGAFSDNSSSCSGASSSRNTWEEEEEMALCSFPNDESSCAEEKRLALKHYAVKLEDPLRPGKMLEVSLPEEDRDPAWRPGTCGERRVESAYGDKGEFITLQEASANVGFVRA